MTIRRILEKVANYGYGQCDGGCSGEELNIDQALTDIQAIIDEVKPEKCGIPEFDLIADQYQSNLKARLK